MDLKSTLNLPKTPLHEGQSASNEPKMLARWEQMAITNAFARRKGAPLYILQMTSIYERPDSPWHGHDKCLKDFIVKSKTMSGMDAPYVPGWDWPGLPIENQSRQELAAEVADATHPTFGEAASMRRVSRLQRQQFKRIGVLDVRQSLRDHESASTSRPFSRPSFRFTKTVSFTKACSAVYCACMTKLPRRSRS